MRFAPAVLSEISRYRGREIDTGGDGFLASFDGPARAIRCALAIVDALDRLCLPARRGLHTGECELVGEKLTGIAVHVGARVRSKRGRRRGPRLRDRARDWSPARASTSTTTAYTN